MPNNTPKDKSVCFTSGPPNGIMSTMLVSKFSSLSDVNPTISGFTYQASSTLPEKSLMLNIYQDSNQAETRYLPVQALQSCFRYKRKQLLL